MSHDPTPDGEIIQVVLHDAMVDPFKAWLTSRGLEMRRLPSEAGELPTFVVTVSPQLMALVVDGTLVPPATLVSGSMPGGWEAVRDTSLEEAQQHRERAAGG